VVDGEMVGPYSGIPYLCVETVHVCVERKNY